MSFFLTIGAAVIRAIAAHAELDHATNGPVSGRRAFIAACEGFESLPDSLLFAVVGLICVTLLVADQIERRREGSR